MRLDVIVSGRLSPFSTIDFGSFRLSIIVRTEQEALRPSITTTSPTAKTDATWQHVSHTLARTRQIDNLHGWPKMADVLSSDADWTSVATVGLTSWTELNRRR